MCYLDRTYHVLPTLDYLTIDLSTLLSYCARRKLPEEGPNVLFQVWRIDGGQCSSVPEMRRRSLCNSVSCNAGLCPPSRPRTSNSFPAPFPPPPPHSPPP